MERFPRDSRPRRDPPPAAAYQRAEDVFALFAESPRERLVIAWRAGEPMVVGPDGLEEAFDAAGFIRLEARAACIGVTPGEGWLATCVCEDGTTEVVPVVAWHHYADGSAQAVLADGGGVGWGADTPMNAYRRVEVWHPDHEDTRAA